MNLSIRTLEEVEWRHIMNVLIWNTNTPLHELADALGVHRNTLARKMASKRFREFANQSGFPMTIENVLKERRRKNGRRVRRV